MYDGSKKWYKNRRKRVDTKNPTACRRAFHIAPPRYAKSVESIAPTCSRGFIVRYYFPRRAITRIESTRIFFAVYIRSASSITVESTFSFLLTIVTIAAFSPRRNSCIALSHFSCWPSLIAIIIIIVPHRGTKCGFPCRDHRHYLFIVSRITLPLSFTSDACSLLRSAIRIVFIDFS